MGFGAFSLFIIVGTVLSWISWLMVLSNVDPEAAGFLGFFLFYLSFFFALYGTLFLLGNFIRRHFVRKRLPVERVTVSLRQAAVLSFMVIAWGVLQGSGHGSIINTILLVVAATVVEFFFMSQKPKIPSI